MQHTQPAITRDNLEITIPLSPGRFIKYMRFLLSCTGVLLFTTVKSQCVTAPSTIICNPVGSTALANNDVVAITQVKTVTANLALGNMTVSGGQLIVCGNLTLTGIAFTSGTIIINPGASIVINPSGSVVFGTGCVIYNYGIFSITSSLVTGQNNLIFNCIPAAVFNVFFNQFVVQGPNTSVVNYGVINSSYVITSSSNSPNTFCLAPGSMINANIMINQYANAFTSPVAYSCINITSQIINSQPMTATSNIKICYMAASVGVVGSTNFGSATVNSTCTSCSAALPLKLLSFAGTCTGEDTELIWLTQDERMTDFFLIEKSKDGVNYSVAGCVKAKENAREINRYGYPDHKPALDESIVYYRLKQVDKNGDFDYSPVLAVNCSSQADITLFPNIVSDKVITVFTNNGFEWLILKNVQGNTVYTETGHSEKIKVVSLPGSLPCGVYVVTIISGSKALRKKLIIN